MNIFMLDTDPTVAAQMHCDKHVVKCAVEYAQILSTVHHIHQTQCAQDRAVYEPVPARLPSVLWTNASKANYAWVFRLWVAVMDEYTYRYGKTHESSRLVPHLSHMPAHLPEQSDMPVPLVMPAWCRVTPDDPVTCYRYYYVAEKMRMLTWHSPRSAPAWFAGK